MGPLHWEAPSMRARRTWTGRRVSIPVSSHLEGWGWKLPVNPQSSLCGREPLSGLWQAG